MQSVFGKRSKRLHVNVFLWYATTRLVTRKRLQRLQSLPKALCNGTRQMLSAAGNCKRHYFLNDEFEITVVECGTEN